MKNCIIYQNQSTFVSYSDDGSQERAIRQDGYILNPSPTQSSMIGEIGLESNLTLQSNTDQDLLHGMQSTLDKLSPSVSSDQLKYVYKEGDRLDIRRTYQGHAQLHDRSDDSKRPAAYDNDKRNAAEVDSLVYKSVSNHSKTSDDALTFEKLLEIAMIIPTFNDADTDNPRPI